MSDFNRQDLVYGLDPYVDSGTLVFLPRQYAHERAAELGALRSASTMSEVVALELPHLGHYFDDYRSEEDPHRLGEDSDDEPYDLEEDISNSDGEFPPMLAQWAVANGLFPAEVLPGVVEETVFNGAYLKVDPDRETAVIAHLTAAGYRCERDDDLVLRCSYTADDVAAAHKLIAEKVNQ